MTSVLAAVTIRQERTGDELAITAVIDAAFGRESESCLVRNLRANPVFVHELSLVAILAGVIVGHLLLFPVTISGARKTANCLALAPLSVAPEHHRRGIGSELVKEGLRRARRMGYGSVIVLGHGRYYRRFGFEAASKWGVLPPFKVPDPSFLALELRPGTLSDTAGVVQYPKEFKEV